MNGLGVLIDVALMVKNDLVIFTYIEWYTGACDGWREFPIVKSEWLSVRAEKCIQN